KICIIDQVPPPSSDKIRNVIISPGCPKVAARSYVNVEVGMVALSQGYQVQLQLPILSRNGYFLRRRRSSRISPSVVEKTKLRLVVETAGGALQPLEHAAQLGRVLGVEAGAGGA